MATPTNIIIDITCEMKAKPHPTDTSGLRYIVEVDLKAPERFIRKLARLCKRYRYKLSVERESAAK